MILALGLFLSFFASAQNIVLTEDFSSASGNTPPAGWNQNLISGNSAYDYWRFDNPGGRVINPPISGTFAIFDSDAYSSGGNAEDVALESPSFDASTYGTLLLKSDMYFLGGYGGTAY
ncbi:MAG: hypothetical protein AAFQ68_05865, partial [Bacteroidota bacterium]